jgi:hypothetical protein
VSFGDVWRRCGPEEDMDGPPQGSQVQVPGADGRLRRAGGPSLGYEARGLIGWTSSGA